MHRHAVPGAVEYLVEAARNASFSPVDVRIDNVEGTSNGLTMHSSLIGTAPVAPSAVRANTQTFTEAGMEPVSEPRALSLDEIRQVIEDYGTAAKNALQAGFEDELLAHLLAARG